MLRLLFSIQVLTDIFEENNNFIGIITVVYDSQNCMLQYRKILKKYCTLGFSWIALVHLSVSDYCHLGFRVLSLSHAQTHTHAHTHTTHTDRQTSLWLDIVISCTTATATYTKHEQSVYTWVKKSHGHGMISCPPLRNKWEDRWTHWYRPALTTPNQHTPTDHKRKQTVFLAVTLSTRHLCRSEGNGWGCNMRSTRLFCYQTYPVHSGT